MNNPVSITPGIDAIDLHVRSYRSALKGTLEITINSLSNSQLKMRPILHPNGEDPQIFDTAAFVYSVFRLPEEIDRSRKVIVGQTPGVFKNAGFPNVDSWQKIYTPGRRRTTHFNPNSRIFASFAASISDVDDLTNLLIAYQTEWNKLHTILHSKYKTYLSLKKDLKNNHLLENINISTSDWQSFVKALGPKWPIRLKRIYKNILNLRIQLLAGSWVDYAKTTQKWWKNVATTVSPKFHISRQKIYFISSNTHSIINLFTGFVLKNKNLILDSLKKDLPELYKYWDQIKNHQYFIDPNDFLYFASKFYLSLPEFNKDYLKYQEKLGVITIKSSHFLDINTQIFPVKNLLKSPHLDNRLKITKPSKLADSPAIIFNIDYPLGFAAYHVLSEILENVNRINGVYILGKAAVLNSEVGDIQIPRMVFDEHTQNSYMFKNCFNSFFPFTNNQGSILTNQKSVSVLGTFLENEALLQKYSENNLTVIEMESGPYLNAITEATYDQQTPKNTIIDLNNAPFDVGIINYASDTPYSKAKNLGNHHLRLDGAEPVYLGSLAILQRIINLEESTT
ncbi:MAG: hypothetical protein WC841_04045 [Candidatus Shapirobacteria bacterium]|jgi:hypothetical protein